MLSLAAACLAACASRIDGPGGYDDQFRFRRRLIGESSEFIFGACMVLLGTGLRALIGGALVALCASTSDFNTATPSIPRTRRAVEVRKAAPEISFRFFSRVGRMARARPVERSPNPLCCSGRSRAPSPSTTSSPCGASPVTPRHGSGAYRRCTPGAPTGSTPWPSGTAACTSRPGSSSRASATSPPSTARCSVGCRMRPCPGPSGR